MGSFGVDIDFRFNTASALKNAADFNAKYKALMADAAAGVEGAAKKADQALASFSRSVISNSTRATRQVEASIRAVERQAEMAGKSVSEQILIRQQKHIKAVGDDTEAVKRLTAAYQQLVKVQEEREKKEGGGHGGVANLLFRGTKDIFEGRMTYGVMDYVTAGQKMMANSGGGGLGGMLGSAASSISATTLVVGGLTVALGASAFASLKAAEAMGEYAEQVHRTQLITGMSAREVQQFQVAAKMTGQDVSVLNRMMRGLTQAVEDTGSQGRRARETLQGMGVDLHSLQSGSLGTMQLLDQVSSALEKQPNRWMRNKEAIDLFKRSGIDALPTITELHETLERTGNMNFLSQEKIDQFAEVHKQIVLMGAEWEQFKLSVESLIAKPAIFIMRIITDDAQGSAASRFQRQFNVHMTPQGPVAERKTPESPIGNMLTPEFQERMRLQGQRQEFMTHEERYNIEAAERKLGDLKRTVDELREKPIRDDKTLANIRAATAEYAKQNKIVENLKQTETDRKAIEEALRRSRLLKQQREENPFLLPAEAELNRALRMHGLDPNSKEAKELKLNYGPQITFERTQQADKFQRQMLETQQTVTREMDRARVGGVMPVNIHQLGQDGVTRADVVSDINAQEEQRRNIAMETFRKEDALIRARQIDAKDTVSLEQQRRDIVANTGKLATAQIEAEMAKKREMYALDERARDLAKEHVKTMSKIQLADQEESIKHDADLARKRAELRFKGDNPAAGIAESYRIAVTESQQLYDLEMERIRLHETGFKAEEDAAIALHKLHREDETAREEAQFKLAQMQQQQLDTLKGKIEPLYHTLFTDPKNFGSQLRQTVQEAALHPIVSGLSEMTATALHPMIYGATGTGGIAGALGGMFGGGHKLTDISLLPDKTLPVTIMNDRSGRGGGGGGGIGTSLYSLGGHSSVGGTGGGFSPMDTYSPVGTTYSNLIGPGGGGGGFSVPTMSFGPGGTPGFAPGSVGLPDYGGTFGGIPSFGGGVGNVNAGMGPAAMGGGGFGMPGFGGGTAGGGRGFNLKSLTGLTGLGWKQMFGLSKPAVWGETPGGESLARAAGGLSFGGKLKGIGGSPAARAGAGMVGSMVAQAGLLGEARGTAGGVFEGMLGGAGVGFSMGGPLGAAIGVGVGLAIGIGEVIAGVESPRREAKRLVQQLYHISINSSTADQIVSIANQSYGNRVSIAVGSPEVRHMLGLYAAGTGQNLAASSNDAHGASLVESSGRLMQQATYQYGQAYSQSSNLPIYGGSPTHVIGAPGGNLSLSLNIGGQDAARFMTGNVVTPDVVQSQYAMAMNNSSGRIGQALMMSEPGSIAS